MSADIFLSTGLRCISANPFIQGPFLFYFSLEPLILAVVVFRRAIFTQQNTSRLSVVLRTQTMKNRNDIYIPK
jgi:hypothetical protein